MSEKNPGLSADERAAAKARTAELRAEAKRAKGAEKTAAELKDCVDAIEAMDGLDAQLAQTIHRVVAEHAPQLTARTWYGMPAYALDGKVILFFQAAAKFKARYATLGFDGAAALDEGLMWPTAYALTGMDSEIEARITALVRRAAGQ